MPVSGKVYGASELMALTEAALEFWLTTGRFNDMFEERFRRFLRVKHALTVNSGSSANLLAVAALCSPSLGERALKPGDEVITVAAAFPTTVNPLLLYGLVPVFVDVELGRYNLRADQLESAITPRTRAIMAAHTLGNPFDLDAVMSVVRKHRLWLVEDACDALGSTYLADGRDEARPVGTFGHIGTASFYPAHHITMGEGGAVYTDDAKLKMILASLRDWGRDCFCDTGKDDTCGKRFGWSLGELPFGYDHKYIYSQAGYNLKITDLQAAVGLAQLERLPGFIAARKKNFARLHERLKRLDRFLLLPEPTPKSDPAWFGFPITLRDDCPVRRLDVLMRLTEKRVGTRLLFGGNLTRQPYFRHHAWRAAAPLTNTDIVMERAFWVGVYPGLSEHMVDYIADSITTLFDRA